MTDFPISLDKLKKFWASQVHDEQKWDMNKKLLRALGLFAGSIIVMRNFEDAFAV